VSSFAEALLSGQAYVVNDGQGICNSLYVDNLVHALTLASDAHGVDGEAFLIGDAERVTWADLYRPIAEQLGFDFDRVPRIEGVSVEQWKAQQGTRAAQTFRAVSSRLPHRLRKIASAALGPPRRRAARPSLWETPSTPRPEATLEMSLLYDCDYRLPGDKAARLLRYAPIVSFAEGCRRTLGWLEFAGYRRPPGNQVERTT
jgi:nucleoside-diphosphate-sugar epimerase